MSRTLRESNWVSTKQHHNNLDFLVVWLRKVIQQGRHFDPMILCYICEVLTALKRPFNIVGGDSELMLALGADNKGSVINGPTGLDESVTALRAGEIERAIRILRHYNNSCDKNLK